MIEKIRDYIATCPFLGEFTEINVNYLVDRVKAYSINEKVGYNPIINEDRCGNAYMQFLFSFDAKFYWNEELENNIKNSLFFEKFRDWLKNNNDNNIYPEIEDIMPETIGATTNGFIFAVNSDEAIFRIDCMFTYMKWRND